MHELQVVSSYAATLGEGPRWIDGRLYWLDIVNRQLRIHQPGADERVLELPFMPGCIESCGNGRLAVAWEQGLACLDPESGESESICDPEADRPKTRFNDGGIDPAGRLWAGTMGYEGEPELGTLYMFDFEGQPQERLSPVTISNGIVWSPDGQTMFYIDTPTRAVQAFDFDVESGEIANGRPVLHITDGAAMPDGMAIDADGNLWIALWDGNAVVCGDPRTGKWIDRVEVPVQRVSACAFGGDDLRTLYVTTARLGLEDAALEGQPLAGRLFAAQPGVQGISRPSVKLKTTENPR